MIESKFAQKEEPSGACDRPALTVASVVSAKAKRNAKSISLLLPVSCDESQQLQKQSPEGLQEYFSPPISGIPMGDHRSARDSSPARIGDAVPNNEIATVNKVGPGHLDSILVIGPWIPQNDRLKLRSAIGLRTIGNRGDHLRMATPVRISQPHDQRPTQRKVINHIRIVR